MNNQPTYITDEQVERMVARMTETKIEPEAGCTVTRENGKTVTRKHGKVVRELKTTKWLDEMVGE